MTELLYEDRPAENMLQELGVTQSPHIDFVAALPQSLIINTSLPLTGKTLGEALTDLEGFSLASKWRGDLLLLSYTSGFANNDSVADAPPYPLYRFVCDRHDAFAASKRIRLADMVAMTRLGSQKHWQAVGRDYPAAFPYLAPNQQQLPDAYPVLAALAKQKNVSAFETETGVAVAALRLPVREALGMPQSVPRDARVTFRQLPPGQHHRGTNNECVFVLTSASKKPTLLLSFTYMPPPDRKTLTTLRDANRKEKARTKALLEKMMSELPPPTAP